MESSDTLTFEAAVELAADIRVTRGWQVETIGLVEVDAETGQERWQVTVRRMADATRERFTLTSEAAWETTRMNCPHLTITLTPAADGSYGAVATCAECGQSVGGPERQNPYTLSAATNSQLASMLGNIRSILRAAH